MEISVKELWQEVLTILRKEVDKNVSFDTWLYPIKPLTIRNRNVFVIETPNIMGKNVVESSYKKKIVSALKELTNIDFTLEIVVEGEYSIPYSENLYNSDDDNSYSNVVEGTILNPKYIFEDFVVGNSNKFAHAASLAVAEHSAKSYNPLFLYGGVGLGKTHLMHAIGHHILEKNPQMKIIYVTSEQFTNELIDALKDGKAVEFRSKYRNIEVFLVDDIQFIAGKERTQEEFFHTFNTLHQAGKKIILSSDRPPKEIKDLEDRLCSRFEWGLLADIQPPDFETRIAILRKKAETENLNIGEDIFDFISKNIRSNIRELEGALNKIVAFCTLNNVPPSLEVTNEALKDLINASNNRVINVELIKKIVSQYYNIKPELFNTKKRNREISYPRQISMFLSRELIPDITLLKIGEEFGGRDHTTVMHAIKSIQKDIIDDYNVKSTIDKIKKDIVGD